MQPFVAPATKGCSRFRRVKESALASPGTLQRKLNFAFPRTTSKLKTDALAHLTKKTHQTVARGDLLDGCVKRMDAEIASRICPGTGSTNGPAAVATYARPMESGGGDGLLARPFKRA